MNGGSLIQRRTDECEDGDDDGKSEGFWRELFLLKPDTKRLGDMLDTINADTLIHIQVLPPRPRPQSCFLV